MYNALNVVSAFDVGNGLSLYQQAAQNKGQEGQIDRDIIDILACKDCIVTLDALHRQTNTLETIVKNKGDFIIQVKANQRNLHNAITEHFKAHYDSKGQREETQSNDHAHGRSESRLVMQLPSKLPK
ncbi:hypothetical protein PA25_05160 [Pseudoalteromonas sp. A25]|nr:hypothetical protein PA25_05160 [Pseudoalteromonas sp. A25]